MRVLVSGQKQFGVDVADLVVKLGHTLTAIVSPAYTGSEVDIPYAYGDDTGMRPDRLRAWAYAHEVPWLQAQTLLAERVEACDVIIAAHSRAFLGARTRARAKVAAIGYHPSLLPLHRGRDAVRWTIRDRDRVTGGSVYHLTNAVDAGPIAAQAFVLVPPDATPTSLWRDLLHPLGVQLIRKVLVDLAVGRHVQVPQDEACATWEPSWQRPRLHRPELPELPATAGGIRYVTDPSVLRAGGL